MRDRSEIIKRIGKEICRYGHGETYVTYTRRGCIFCERVAERVYEIAVEEVVKPNEA